QAVGRAVNGDRERAGSRIAAGVGGFAIDSGGAHWKSGAGRRRADQGDIAAIVSGSDGVVNDRSTLIRRGRLHDIGRTHDGRLVGVLDGDGLVGGGVVAAAVGGLVSAGNGDHAAVGGVGVAHNALRHA